MNSPTRPLMCEAVFVRTAILRMMASGALVGLASLPVTAQSEPTLRELAIQNGLAGRSVDACGPQPSLSDTVERADVIAEVVVRTSAAYLTADERDVFTDYDVAIRRVLFQREVVTSSRPGLAFPIIFKSQGGNVVIDGLRISVDINVNGQRVRLDEGDHVYLFAKRDISDGKWLFNPLGVFKVRGADVVTPETFRDLPRVVPLETFVQQIYRLIPAASFRP